MATRTSTTAVRGVLQSEDRPDPEFDLEPFVLAANAVVSDGFLTEVLYPATTLELIERFLAAHFFVTSRIGKSGSQKLRSWTPPRRTLPELTSRNRANSIAPAMAASRWPSPTMSSIAWESQRHA